jgi:hypothetical protein
MFRLPIHYNKNQRMKSLDSQRLAELQSFLTQMEFICIDEVSMLTTVHLGIILLIIFF